MKTNTPEKIWIDPASDLPKLSGHIDKDSVEYIRKDAFIEKAAEWIKNKAENYIVDTPLCSYFDYKRAVDDFKNYMKGEKV
jgi:hypothetical protein